MCSHFPNIQKRSEKCVLRQTPATSSNSFRTALSANSRLGLDPSVRGQRKRKKSPQAPSDAPEADFFEECIFELLQSIPGMATFDAQIKGIDEDARKYDYKMGGTIPQSESAG